MTVKETTVACVTLLFAAILLTAPCHAQSDPADGDEARIADLVTASHMLANEGSWTASDTSARYGFPHGTGKFIALSLVGTDSDIPT